MTADADEPTVYDCVLLDYALLGSTVLQVVCVCLCVFVRERERERGRESGTLNGEPFQLSHR